MLDDLTMGTIVSGSVLGLLGLFMFLYGKREGRPMTVIAGLILGILPMVMHAMLPLWLVSAGLVGGVVVHRRHADTSPIA
ncbi:MAG TPA: hypothetical protein ENJ00_06865 [Phycisphaerales bacterium]|nr:hypothetical protein [Phycisphaerales bacterium]